MKKDENLDPSNVLSDAKVSEYLEMAFKGKIFNFEQIVKLGNPKAKSGITMAHLCCPKNSFSVEELLYLKNPADSDGDTVAHFMAMAGHRFSREEIIALGDPSNSTGKAIPHIMANKVYTPNVSGKKNKDFSRFVDHQNNYFVAKYLERFQGNSQAGYWCTLFINGTLAAEMQNNGSEYSSMMVIADPEVFKLYIKENYRRYGKKNKFDFDIKEDYQPLELAGCDDDTRFYLDELIDEKWKITPIQK